MKANFSNYNYENSRTRIDEILSASNDSFEELDNMPSRDQLTFTNGFYFNCTALFVDIRGSSNLPENHTRPVLAKIYRAYISELVAIMNGNNTCKEINIHGDSVWGVFDTPYKSNIDSAFSVAYISSSLVEMLNLELRKKEFKEISVGIGMDYGRVLMIKSGYNGSGINEVVWMGDVVNKASKLCHYGNRSWNDKEIMVSSEIYNNLNDHNKELLSWNSERNCYSGNVICTDMNEWVQDNQ